MRPPEDIRTYGAGAIIEAEDAINRKWDAGPDYRMSRDSEDRASGPYAHVQWDPEVSDGNGGGVDPGPVHAADHVNVMARQYGIPRDLLVDNKLPQPHQYGIYDRRTDHVYEKPT